MTQPNTTERGLPDCERGRTYEEICKDLATLECLSAEMARERKEAVTIHAGSVALSDPSQAEHSLSGEQ